MSSPTGPLVYSVRSWSQLSRDRLYELLRLRSDVFVVEQASPYPDLDGRDQESQHLLGVDADQRLRAYARWYQGDGDEILLGRIVVDPALRGTGVGRSLLDEALRRIGDHQVRIGAQRHLEGYYQQFGFRAVEEPWDDFGVPHVFMVRSPG